MHSISLVLSRLDYCNSLLCRQPNYLLYKLQALQNHAAKKVLQADYFSFSSDCLDHLHWLLVSQRCKFKLLWLISCAFKLEQPAYILIFSLLDTHVNHSDSSTLVSSFIDLFLQACLLVALSLTRLHVCEIHFLLICAHHLLS